MIVVKYIGRLGNNLFQYCLGRIMATELGFDLIAEPIEGFPNAISWKQSRDSYLFRKRVLLKGHRLNLAAILADRRRRRIALKGFFQRYEYYRPYKELIRADWLGPEIPPRFPDDELTISIRAGDIWQQQTQRWIHPDYVALPFSFYERILERGNWNKVHVISEDRDDPMAQKIATRYEAEVYSGSVLSDFTLLRSSSNIVLSVSTFSWWAAWLSNARRVFVPRVGLFDPAVRPDVDLQVDDEDRYENVAVNSFPVWEGSEEQRRLLLEM